MSHEEIKAVTVLLIYTHLFLHLEHHLLLKQFGFKVEILEKVGCSLHHKRELRGGLGNFKKSVLHFHDSVKVTEIKFKRLFDKHILLHGDEAGISANPLELSLFNKTPFLHVALRKLQRQPSSALLFTQPKHRDTTLASVPGKRWAGGRASAQGREKDVGREGILRLMTSETLSPVKGAVL